MGISIEYQPILQAPAAGGVKSIKNNKLCKTKPIYWIPKMNITLVYTKDYENKYNWTLGEIKPNLCHRYQTQSCPPNVE